ncbi:MAG: hypothetical protein AAF429_05315 [Pseudomonadota bacterium]
MKQSFKTLLAAATLPFLAGFGLSNFAYAGILEDERTCAQIEASPYMMSEETALIVIVEEGQTVSWTSPDAGTGLQVAFISSVVGSGSVYETAGSETAPESGEFELYYSAALSSTIGGGPFADIAITCSTSASGAGASAALPASGQQKSMSDAAGRSFAARNGNGTNSFVPTAMFFSTQNSSGAAGSDWSAWVSGSYSKYSGSVDGHGAEIIFGVDRAISPNAVVGVAVGVEDNDYGTDAVKSTAISPYFISELSFGGTFQVMVTRAETEYTGTTTSDGKRLGISFALTGGSIDLNRNALEPYLKFTGYDEDLDNGTEIEDRRALVGFKYTLNSAGDFQTYLRAAIDHHKTTYSSGGEVKFTKPLIGLGFSRALQGGLISAEITRSNIADDAHETTAWLRLNFTF